MTTQRLRPVLINELLDALFSGAAHELHDCCARWCASSPRFATFLERYRDKIRKKLRGVTDGEGLRDLQAELRTAACLLSERGFTLEYEKYAANKIRGPDFSLLFKTHIAFNVEVKRIRGQVQPSKWADVLCYKLGQLPPSISNALVVYGESLGQGAPFDVGAAMAHLRASAERKEEAFFTRRGLEGSREYLRQSSKLSVVVLLQAGAACESSAPLASWINPQARHPLSPELWGALLRSLEAL
jgi:hypothetical protein